jgi:hypothetical protein
MVFLVVGFFIITILLLEIGKFVNKVSDLPQLKHLKGKFPLYFPDPFWSFFIKLVSSTSDMSN